jgi:hypothetical protein
VFQVWGAEEVTYIDLVKGHIELLGKCLFDRCSRLVLGEEVLLEKVVLVFGEARLDVADGRLLDGGSARRTVGLIAGRRVGAHLGVGRVHPRRAEESSGVASDGWNDVGDGVQSARRNGARVQGEAARRRGDEEARLRGRRGRGEGKRGQAWTGVGG